MKLGYWLAAGSLVPLIATAHAANSKGNAMAWQTTSTMYGMEEICMSMPVGNTVMLSIQRGPHLILTRELTGMDIEDCTRGLKIAKKTHQIRIVPMSEIE